MAPASDFYKKLALDLSSQQIAVDLFAFSSSQFIDLSTICELFFVYTPPPPSIQNPWPYIIVRQRVRAIYGILEAEGAGLCGVPSVKGVENCLGP